VPRRLGHWWQTLNGQTRRAVSALALITLVYTGHYLVYCIPQPFYIEDAGISFAYARNLVDGEGLASYAGGERVEGYSNPSWTFLIAAFYALGMPTFTTSKVLGWIFGVATLPLMWALVRRALPVREEAPIHRDTLALIAPLLAAISVQFVVWNASGLENSLFCFLLTWGMLRSIQEIEDGGRPWSALIFFALCASRPEGIMYAAIAGGVRGWHTLFSEEAKADGLGLRWGKLLMWMVVLFVPLVAYHAWRYWYFAWEFPNTYYAKLGSGRAFKPFLWDKKGWKYIVQWFTQHGGMYAIPFVIVGLVGFTRRLRWLGLALLVVVAVLLGWDAKAGVSNPADWWLPVQKYWIKARVWSLAALIPTIWFATLRRPGWRARGMLWLTACAGLFFVVYVGGDWMKAHRWFNLLSVPLLSVFALGLIEVALFIAGTEPLRWFASFRDFFRTGRSRGGLATVLLLLACGSWVANEVRLSLVFSTNPETTVRDIHRRVKYMGWVQSRLDVDHITLLDVDMGAHMFYTDWEIVDIAGLIDVPMARHSDFNKKFLREYLFEERKPDFAHVHGGWARSSRIPKISEFKRNYIEIPGYPIGKRKLHIGNHIRKGIFVHGADTREPIAIFDKGVELLEFNIPSPEVQAGGRLFVETAWRSAYRKNGFRVLISLTAEDGTRTVGAFAPGYDWYPPEEWKRTESVEGKFRVPIPKKFPRGPVAVHIAVVSEATGEVLAHLLPDSTGTGSAEQDAPAVVWMAGEYPSEEGAQIASREVVTKAAETDRKASLQHAEKGRCDQAWPAWKNAVRHRPFRKEYIKKHEPSIQSAISQCYVTRSESAPTQDDQITALLEARKWNHRLPSLLERTQPFAEALDAKGDLAQQAGDLDEAYALFTAAVRLDPRRSWSRRKAEDVRDQRLRITRPGQKKKTAKLKN
jgi:hypothetical protein